MVFTRKLFIRIIDIVLIATAYTLAWYLRFDMALPDRLLTAFWSGLALTLPVKLLVFQMTGLYRRLWRYAALHDAAGIVRSVSLAIVAHVTVHVLVLPQHLLSRSITVLDWLLLTMLVGASRIAWRWRRRLRRPRGTAPRCRTIVVGAGEAGSMLLRECHTGACAEFRIIGFVDDDPAKQGMRLNGVPVLGALSDLAALAGTHRVQAVIVAIPSARAAVLRRITDQCAQLGIKVMTLPSLAEIIGKSATVSELRSVEFNDLLGRDPVTLDESAIGSYLTGRKVLVTGAAGSIGSELCRQVARFAPARLILMDHAETPLFHIDRELQAAWPELEIIPVLGDVKHADKVETIFTAHRPDAVFHAAAYKHVPLMEFNPAEAVMNNIGGTKVVADAAHRCGAADFVMISTDKAVNPANVMGASKRAAEIYVQALSAISRTRFTTVRFGNVLGSNGSVIPLFMEQIRGGGPVTVTDPEITRYFMTIPEAAQLVLQAGCLGTGGEIFVLDMGEPVRIADLAHQLIRLSGLEPDRDIQVVYTGLRPGEKLYEELLADHEGVKPTSHDKIMIAAASRMEMATVNGKLLRLFNITARFDAAGIVQSLRRLVPEFTPGTMHDTTSRTGDQLPPPLEITGRTSGKILKLRPRAAGTDLAGNGDPP